MFRVGEEYLTNGGLKVRILSNDAAFKATTIGPVCNVIGIVTQKAGNQGLHYFDDAGNYAGVPNNATYMPHCLVSDEPNAEEADLIRQIGDLVEGSSGDREAAMLKIIRKLRAK